MTRSRLLVSLLTVLALTLFGCGGGDGGGGERFDDTGYVQPDTSGSETIWPDTQGDTTPPTACASDLECAEKKGEAPACMLWTCDPTAGCVLSNEDNGATCDDRNACTENDKCAGGACLGSGISCNDNNPCTTDTCDPTTGCQNTATDGALCNDADMCTINDHCEAGACGGEMNPMCECDVDDDCLPFEDGDLCNGVMVCVNHACIKDAESIIDCSGVSAGPCEEVACKPTTGTCEKTYRPDGSECSDGSFCTLNDACAAGVCQGSQTNCDDGNPCTNDDCDPVSGCVYLPNAASCNDGDLCTEGDVCQGGACVGTPNPECICNVTADCADFDDGNLCNGTLMCEDGACVVDEATIKSCDPALGSACTEVYCEATSGQCKVKDTLDGTACDDQSACTANDVCNAGACLGAPLTCVDELLCTTDGCDPAVGCTFTHNTLACDDGSDCTSDDVCDEGACVGTPVAECQCTTAADCADNEDGDLCNGTLICQDNQCVVDPGTVVTCDAPTGCTAYACVPETGGCVETEAPDGTTCDDGNACTTIDVCEGGQCKGSEALICTDDDPCTDTQCDPTVGCVSEYNDAICDDGNACTDDDVCAAGTCAGAPNPECQCTATAECATHEDGDLCNGTLICVENKCVVDPATVVGCASVDPEGCQISTCNPLDGQCQLLSLEDGRPCNDKDQCTQTDVCESGSCVGTEPLTCDDGNPCTDEACQPEQGCVTTFNVVGCDDQDECTEGDVCSDGACQPGPVNVCPATCQPIKTVGCGSETTWSTTGTGGTQEVEDYPCVDAALAGPEAAFRFEAPFEGTLDVYLTGEDSTTRLLVLTSSGQGCRPDECVAADHASVTQAMLPDEAYYLVVDGAAAPEGIGLFTLHVACTPAHEQACDDGMDDDQDGLVDCEDTEDCPQGTEACPLPQCVPDWSAWCGMADNWHNYGGGTTQEIDSYACNSVIYDAPEYSYLYTAAYDGTINLGLASDDTNLDLMIIPWAGEDSCLANACTAATDAQAGVTDIGFEVTEGDKYYFVVDGANGATADFTVTMDCWGTNEALCYNKYDDDHDEVVDCADEDCTDDVACGSQTCVEAAALDCGQIVTGETGGALSSNDLFAYGCEGMIDLWSGPEVVYAFTAPYDGNAQVLLDAGDMTRAVLLGDGTGTCDATTTCHGVLTSTNNFNFTAGEIFYVVVDSGYEAVSDYTMSITCWQ